MSDRGVLLVLTILMIVAMFAAAYFFILYTRYKHEMEVWKDRANKSQEAYQDANKEYQRTWEDARQWKLRAIRAEAELVDDEDVESAIESIIRRDDV